MSSRTIIARRTFTLAIPAKLDRAREILLPRQCGGAHQHHPGQERSSTARNEPPLERCSIATAGLSARLVVDAKNNLFG